ncbi:MAG: asparaginase domain-containing protein [Phycisphaeraceae bacterium]
MKIQIFITGGTFDKEYNELTGDLFFQESHLPEMLRRGRSLADTSVQTIMMTDSLAMTDDDRATILDHCLRCDAERILITHGTDTMPETARYLAEHLKNKTIVLTGAMIPYVFGSSDGLFNLGAALAFTQTLPHGVYIAMNGCYFTHDNVRKNKDLGIFESHQ